jgi:hypothetical protein
MSDRVKEIVMFALMVLFGAWWLFMWIVRPQTWLGL